MIYEYIKFGLEIWNSFWVMLRKRFRDGMTDGRTAPKPISPFHFVAGGNKMRSTILSFNFTTSDHTSSFPYPLQLDTTKEYEASLLSLETYNTLFNITEKNDKFSCHLGRIYKTISFTRSIRDFSNIFRNCSPYEKIGWWTKKYCYRYSKTYFKINN